MLGNPNNTLLLILLPGTNLCHLRFNNSKLAKAEKKSVGDEGNGEFQFKHPYGLDVSSSNNNIYVCDCYNHRIQILTKELNYHSLLGIDLLNYCSSKNPKIITISNK